MSAATQSSPHSDPVDEPRIPAERAFHVVGVGASAGGLEAVSALLSALPARPGLSVVVITHLDPRQPSSMVEILSTVTGMKVEAVEDGLEVQKDHVYVNPSTADVVLDDGRFRLVSRESSAIPHLPINLFFTSLAEDRGLWSVGVILSGSGSDGTLGLKSIKDAEGITFAQDLTAAHDAMPRSAIGAGFVDAVLPPDEIASELVFMVKHPCFRQRQEQAGAARPALPLQTEDDFAAVLKYLGVCTGVDFSNYKHGTLLRRVERRMVLRRIETIGEYLARLRMDPSEVQALQHDVLIQVTSFFRDPNAFALLATRVFPRLVEDRSENSPLRIWVPGCATGEEVYSIAIELLEFLDAQGSRVTFKIFATDISESSIERARMGRYVESLVADLSPDRLRRFFVRTDAGYQVHQRVRDLCVFARQDVTKDPPFSNLDLISCRNVLIYLGSTLQNRVFPIFQYALRPGGWLLLGGAESVGAHTDAFEMVDKANRLYRRTDSPSRLSFGNFVPNPNRSTSGTARLIVPEPPRRGQNEVQREADRVVLARYTPPGVVVDEQMRVVQFRGRTGACLEPSPGQPTYDLFQMAREGLLPDLKTALEEARSTGLPSRKVAVRVKTNGNYTPFDVEVIPITAPATGQRHFVVLFEDASLAAGGRYTPDLSAPPHSVSEPEQEIARLRQELDATRAYLNSVMENQEFGHEELTAANEEIVSSNEELQSTNEELETAKEELQATNEELSTMNDELQSRIRTATQLSDDLSNLIDGVNIPIVMLGQDLTIRRFSPSAQKVFNLIPSDVGRRMTDFRLKIDLPDLEPLIVATLETLVVQHREVQDGQGRWYALSIRPYRTLENKIDGVIITLFDIDALKRHERQIVEARDYARNVIETLREPLLVLDDRTRIQWANRAFLETFQVAAEDIQDQFLFSVGGGQWNIPQLRSVLEEVRRSDTPLQGLNVEHDFPELGRRSMILNSRRVVQTEGASSTELILLAIEDVTERRDLEREVLEIASQEQQRIGQDLHDGLGQELTGLGFLARSLAERLSRRKQSEADEATRLADGLAQALEHVRQVARGMATVIVDGQGLMAALLDLCETSSSLSKIPCTLHCPEIVLVKDIPVATQLFYIAREAVTNALRHADPATIEVHLEASIAHLRLEVLDDGVGINERKSKSGMGLKIMSYRAALIGAHLEIVPLESGGTAVQCVWPQPKLPPPPLTSKRLTGGA